MSEDPERISERLREISISDYGLGGFGISEIRRIAAKAAEVIEDQSSRLKAIVSAVDAARGDRK